MSFIFAKLILPYRMQRLVVVVVAAVVFAVSQLAGTVSRSSFSMLLMFIICNSSQICFRCVFSSGVRIFLAMRKDFGCLKRCERDTISRSAFKMGSSLL